MEGHQWCDMKKHWQNLMVCKKRAHELNIRKCERCFNRYNLEAEKKVINDRRENPGA